MDQQNFFSLLNSKLIQKLDARKFRKEYKFNFENLLENKAKLIFYFKKSGNEIYELPKDNDINTENKIINAFLSLIYTLAKNNLIQNDINPNNLKYKKKNVIIEKILPKHMQELNSLRSSFEVGSFIHKMVKTDFIIDSIVCKHKKLTTNKKDEEKNKKILVSENQIDLKFLSFSKSKIENFEFLKQKLLESIQDCLKIFEKSKIIIKLDPSVFFFNFYTFLENYLILYSNEDFKRSKMKLNFSGIKRNEKRFTDELENKIKNKNSKKINFTQLNNYFQEISSSNCKLLNNDNGIPENLSLFNDNLQNNNKFSLLITNEVKNNVYKVIKSIKEIPITNTPKHASILSILKFECTFLNDIESSLYTLLDVLNKYPEDIFIQESLSKINYNPFNKKNNNNRIFELNKNYFITPEQITFLLSILANVDVNDFTLNELGLVWFFKIFNSKKKNQDILDYNFNPKIKKYSKYLSNCERGRFIRLKIILNKICTGKKSHVLRVFDLKYEFLKHILIKLSTKFTIKLPDKLKNVINMYQKFFFNYLIMLMLSKKVHFIHKFCLLIFLNSKCYK